jgi:hypothetical protein
MRGDRRPEVDAAVSVVLSRRDAIRAGAAVMLFAGGTLAPGFARSSAALDPAAATLAQVARDMFPHRDVPQDVFEGFAARQLGTTDPAAREMLRSGIEDLERRAGGDYRALDPVARTRLLGSLAGTPFFGTVRFAALVSLYSDPAVVRLFGYQGASFEQGGYLTRGYDDLRWLADPDS